MRRRIVVRESFDASFADLPDTPETAEVVSALVYAIVRDPERFPVLEETGLRGARSRSHDSYPALRLFYECDDAEIRLIEVAPYDELLE